MSGEAIESEVGSRHKPRLLMVGHVYSTAINRRKLNPMADWFDITCATLPEASVLGRMTSDCEADHEARYELVRLKGWPRRGKITRHVLRGLARLCKGRRYDAVVVDSEPWSWVRWQTWAWVRRWQPKALFGEFTWENVKRPGWKGWLLKPVYQAACRTHDFSISGNIACRNLLLEHGARAERNLVAPQVGVDTALFRPVQPDEKARLRVALGLPRESLVVGYAGRWTESKGICDLLTAVEQVRAKRTEAPVILALMGAGDLAGELRAAQRSRSWLHLLDPRPHQDVADFMRTLDVFVLPSRPVRRGSSVWEEQFGHVLIEAMACEVATIGARSGAIPEVLGMEEAFFESGQPELLAVALKHWLEDDAGRRALAVRQRRRVMEGFSHEAVARIWCEFLLARLADESTQVRADRR